MYTVNLQAFGAVKLRRAAIRTVSLPKLCGFTV